MKRVVSILIAVGASFALVSPAQGALTTESASTILSFGEDDVVAAECGLSSSVMAGGFSAPGFDPIGVEGHYILPFLSTLQDGQSWHAEGYNGNPPDGTFKVYAKCSDKLDQVQLGTESVELATDDLTTINVSCPSSGMDVVSGGFAMDHEGSYQLYAVESKRKDQDTWSLTAYNSGAAGRTANAFAFCTDKNLSIDERSKTVKKKNNRIASATAKCAGSDVAISGGWDGLYTAAKEVYVFESRPKGPKSWKSSSATYTDAGKVKWKALVYCVAPNKV